jgi:hypothetical protein
LSDQAIGAHRVIQFADLQRAPWMRFGKRPLCLPFAITIEDRATEQKDEHCDGEDERTKGKANVGRQPPQRQLPAMLLHGSFVNRVLWQTMVAHGRSVAGEVNETALDVGADEFDVNLLAHVETLEPARQSSFNGRL